MHGARARVGALAHTAGAGTASRAAAVFQRLGDQGQRAQQRFGRGGGQRLRAAGLSVPVVAGGIIPQDDVNVLKQLGVAAVYTPKDFDMNRIMSDLVTLIEKRMGEEAA